MKTLGKQGGLWGARVAVGSVLLAGVVGLGLRAQSPEQAAPVQTASPASGPQGATGTEPAGKAAGDAGTAAPDGAATGAPDGATAATDANRAPDAGGKSTGPSAGKAVQPAPLDFDVQARSRQVLAHLSSVIRYYRSTVTQIQKVGEPSDALYRDTAITNAKLVAGYAFQSGTAEGGLLTAYQKQAGAGKDAPQGEAQKLRDAQANVAQRILAFKAQEKALDDLIAKAPSGQAQMLQAQRQQIEGALDLNAAMSDALGRIVGMSETQGRAGLAGDIEQLQRTAPELGDAKAKVVPVTLESLGAARSAGVSSQAVVMVNLLGTRHAIDLLVRETDALHQQALDLRTPLTAVVRTTVKQAQELSGQTLGVPPPVAQAPARRGQAASAEAAAARAAQLAQAEKMREQFESATATFKELSAAAVPLSQEIITLEQSRANLLTWRQAVDTEYRSVLSSLLLRMLVIGLALGVIFAIGAVWRRATIRYVHEVRRQRQLLGMRRVVIGFLSGLVLVFGFVSQFNSLATFAGFITAGLAVGLQTILLSVAAYFFIIGRYGVRVGDRITVAGVTGDVIEVGLVRFYVMELASGGLGPQPTGRVAVFSNAILFQAGTPLYKQMPGTEYAWQEMTVKLAPSSDYAQAQKAILGGVQKVYEGYREKIEMQHRSASTGMDASINAPGVESRLQLIEGGLQLLVRFPVEIRNTSTEVQQMTQVMLQLMQEDAVVKGAVTAAPTIKAAATA